METSDRTTTILPLDEVARQVHLTNSGSVLRYLRDGRLRGLLRSRYHGWQVTQADVDEFNRYVEQHGALPPVGWASPPRAKDRRAVKAVDASETV